MRKPIKFVDIFDLRNSQYALRDWERDSLTAERVCVTSRHALHTLVYENVYLTLTVIAFSMSSGNVIIIPVDGSKNSDRAVNCKPLFEYYSSVRCLLRQILHVQI